MFIVFGAFGGNSPNLMDCSLNGSSNSPQEERSRRANILRTRRRTSRKSNKLG